MNTVSIPICVSFQQGILDFSLILIVTEYENDWVKLSQSENNDL